MGKDVSKQPRQATESCHLELVDKIPEFETEWCRFVDVLFYS